MFSMEARPMQTSNAAATAVASFLLLAPLMLSPSQAGSPPDLKGAVNASQDGIVLLVGNGHRGGGHGGHGGGGWGGKMGGGWGRHMGGGPRFAGHRGGGGPSASGPSRGGRFSAHNGGNGNHSANAVDHHGEFKIVHNPNVDGPRLNGNRSDSGLVHDGQFKMVHNPNVENRGNHLDNDVDHGQFKMIHNPNVGTRRLNGNHFNLDNQMVHTDGHFRIAHNPTFDHRRLDGNQLDNHLVDGFNFVEKSNLDRRFDRNDLTNDLFDDLFDLFVDSGFKIHNPNFDNRRFNNFFSDGFFSGGFPWWWGNEGNNCWVWWPDDGWVWQCS